ncbi:DUF6671 family protein [Pseudomonas sp. MBLB4136]|uniref:DUF6671 family protein n=1 Tax=Pseudomonas sp. MBLB4136 TaxID=3451558 RepID=UPI003F754F19
MQTLAFLTCHGKTPLVAEPLAACGYQVLTVGDYDTDRFGTFSREVERPGSAQETALAKARMAAERAGSRFGLGSEGSFGRDPYLGCLPWDSELLCWWDRERGYPVYASQGSSDTNYAQRLVTRLDEVEQFATQIGFPEHGLILGRSGEPWFSKGLRVAGALQQAAAILAAQGELWLESDMRAHLNPSRQRVIRSAAGRLAERLSCRCPQCTAPGFALARIDAGQRCRACDYPTRRATREHWLCPACSHGESREIQGWADPADCQLCNP